MVYLIAALTMPVVGLAIDKTGYNLVWLFAGLLTTLASHLLLAFTFLEPYVCVVRVRLILQT